MDYLSPPLIASKRLGFVIGYMRVGRSRGLFLGTKSAIYCVWLRKWSIRVVTE